MKLKLMMIVFVDLQMVFWTMLPALQKYLALPSLGKYSKNYTRKFCGIRHEGGGGDQSRRFFLQKPYRIILGPPKHVLHLVCIVWAYLQLLKQL